MNYALIIFAFILGYFVHKKKDNIVNFIESMKILYNMNKKKDMKYNDFFEADFHVDDYIEKGESDNNV